MVKNSILNQMAKWRGFSSHMDYLQSPAWKLYLDKYRQVKLPECCIACSYPKTFFYYITTDNYGEEKLGDVIPICSECFTNIRRIGNVCFPNPGRCLQMIFKWTEKEKDERLVDFQPYWVNKEDELIQSALKKFSEKMDAINAPII